MAPWKHKGLIYSPLPNSETDGDFSMSYSGTEIVNLTLRGSLLRIYILLIHIALFVSSILMAYHDDIWGGMTYSQPSKLQKYEIRKSNPRETRAGKKQHIHTFFSMGRGRG